MRIRLSTAIVLVALAGGCSGDTARVKVQGPQLAAMSHDILADAEIGVRAQENATIAGLLGVPAISPGLAETKRVHHSEFAAGMASFGRTAAPARTP